MKKENILLWGLVALFAVMMSIPFLIPHTGLIALFGIVPPLCMERIADLNGKKHVLIYHYTAFVLWNAITTFWVCNATIGGGIFAVLANSLQMSLVFGLFRLSKRKQPLKILLLRSQNQIIQRLLLKTMKQLVGLKFRVLVLTILFCSIPMMQTILLMRIII